MRTGSKILAALAGLNILGMDIPLSSVGYERPYKGVRNGHSHWNISFLTPKQRKARKKAKAASKSRAKMYRAV